MPRKIPASRLTDLVRAATHVFIAQGYRRTQMADVAEALGVAKGTVYLYVESKEALFDLAIRYADAPEEAEKLESLPLPTPPPGATVDYVRTRMQAESLPLLQAALERKRSTDTGAELESIVRELYAVLGRNRRTIKLVDRSAVDHPELATVWFEGGRGGALLALTQYLKDRQHRRRLRTVPDIDAAARFMLEAIVFWSVHRHWDPHPQAIDDAVAEDTVVRFVVGALKGEKEE